MGVSEELSEADLARLASRLAENPNAEGLSLEGVDGFFCALVASPTLVPPSVHLPVIFGGDEPSASPAFEDEQDAPGRPSPCSPNLG